MLDLYRSLCTADLRPSDAGCVSELRFLFGALGLGILPDAVGNNSYGWACRHAFSTYRLTVLSNPINNSHFLLDFSAPFRFGGRQ